MCMKQYEIRLTSGKWVTAGMSKITWALRLVVKGSSVSTNFELGVAVVVWVGSCSAELCNREPAKSPIHVYRRACMKHSSRRIENYGKERKKCRSNENRSTNAPWTESAKRDVRACACVYI